MVQWSNGWSPPQPLRDVVVVGCRDLRNLVHCLLLSLEGSGPAISTSSPLKGSQEDEGFFTNQTGKKIGVVFFGGQNDQLPKMDQESKRMVSDSRNDLTQTQMMDPVLQPRARNSPSRVHQRCGQCRDPAPVGRTDLEDLWWLLNQKFGRSCTSMSWIWEAAMK